MFISCNTFANVDIFIIVRGKKSHGFTSFLPCPPYFPFIYKGETKGMEKGNNKDFYIFTGMNNTEFLRLPKVWENMTPSELMVYVVLRDMWQMMKNKEGFFTSSYNEIAKRCKLSRKSVITIMNKLVFFGYVSTSEQTGNAPIYYTFQPAKWCKKYDGRGVKNTT